MGPAENPADAGWATEASPSPGPGGDRVPLPGPGARRPAGSAARGACSRACRGRDGFEPGGCQHARVAFLLLPRPGPARPGRPWGRPAMSNVCVCVCVSVLLGTRASYRLRHLRWEGPSGHGLAPEGRRRGGISRPNSTPTPTKPVPHVPAGTAGSRIPWHGQERGRALTRPPILTCVAPADQIGLLIGIDLFSVPRSVPVPGVDKFHFLFYRSFSSHFVALKAGSLKFAPEGDGDQTHGARGPRHSSSGREQRRV